MHRTLTSKTLHFFFFFAKMGIMEKDMQSVYRLYHEMYCSGYSFRPNVPPEKYPGLRTAARYDLPCTCGR